MNKKAKIKQNPGGIIAKYAFLLVMAFMFAMPMIFTLLSSVKTKTEIFAKPFDLPAVFQWGNYTEAWQAANMSRYFMCQQSGRLIGILVLHLQYAVIDLRIQNLRNKTCSDSLQTMRSRLPA